jgi:hypothetical protein
MTADGHMGDRRDHLRFEVMGLKSASLLTNQTMWVLNLGASGALVESTLPLPPNAEYRMQLVLEGHVTEATVKVRRIAEVGRDSSELRYRIGLEFLAISPEAEDVIRLMVSADEAQL